MSLGVKYLIAWPLLSAVLIYGYLRMVRAIHRDQARYAARRARYIHHL